MDWLVWQLVDSALPTGSFAHSLGLEAAWQQGGVDAASLPRFVRDVLAHAGRSALPFVTAGHRTPDGPGKNGTNDTNDTIDTIDTIDARCDAFLTGVVANRASRTQGRAWLATMERAFPRPPVQALCTQVRSGSLARHYAPLFGATLRALEVDRPTTQRVFLYTTCRSTLSAAVRLGVIGTTDAQRLIAGSAGDLERTFERCSTLGVDDAAQTAPLIDLWQSAHDRLYSRLFQS